MKTKLLIFMFSLSVMLSSCRKITNEEATALNRWAADIETILVIVVSGSVDDTIFDAVEDEASLAGVHLILFPTIESNVITPINYVKFHGEASAYTWDQESLKGTVLELIQNNGNDSSKMSLVFVGKSLGAVLTWATFRNHSIYMFNKFRRVAMVLIDPYGQAYGDDSTNIYGPGYPLYWPDTFPTNNTGWGKDRFRLYHIFQQKAGNLMGADFQKEESDGTWVIEKRLCNKIDLTNKAGIKHQNIVQQSETHVMINNALLFASHGDWWYQENPCEIT